MSDASLGYTETPGSPPPANGDAEVVRPEGVEVAPPDDRHEPRPEPDPAQGMIPGRVRRRTKLERASMRILATGGIVGVATALGAVLVDNDIAGWIVGMVVGLTSVVLAAVLWSSRQL